MKTKRPKNPPRPLSSMSRDELEQRILWLAQRMERFEGAIGLLWRCRVLLRQFKLRGRVAEQSDRQRQELDVVELEQMREKLQTDISTFLDEQQQMIARRAEGGT